MVWPPVTHQDVQDELGTIRTSQGDYLRTGAYSLGLFGSGTPATSTLSAGNAYVRPFWLNTTRTFDRIGVNVATAATAGSGGTIACAIYQPGLGMPGAFVLETATVSSETTGAKEFTITQTLTPGPWWVGVRAATANCSVTAFTNGSHPFLSVSTTPPTAGQGALSQGATTAFPNPWTGTTVQSAIYFVSLRAA